MKTYITDPKDIQAVRDGTASINGKSVLIADSDMRTATKRIFFAFKDDPDLAIVAGLGLAKKSSAVGQYRRLSVPELKELILEKFVLVREQAGVSGGPPRLEILSDPPSPFWLVTILQGRWIDPEV